MPRSLHDLDAATAQGIRWVLFDIDDTVTSHGRLRAQAYAAMERLHEAGLRTIPITGRPAGWCDHIARFWPVDAVVGENGALWMSYDRIQRRMRRRFWQSEDERRATGDRLAALGAEVLRRVPGTAIASDQGYRACDIAIDFAEDVAPLPQESALRIVDIFAAAGAQAKVSSIHVNAWFGDWDKLAMTRMLFRDLYGLEVDDLRAQIAFAGDSPNDAPMFAFFPLSVGVANIRPHLGLIPTPPSFISEQEGGAGFAELADRLLACR